MIYIVQSSSIIAFKGILLTPDFGGSKRQQNTIDTDQDQKILLVAFMYELVCNEARVIVPGIYTVVYR